MKVDYLIAGGGLCGILLARNLVQAGRSVVVIDDNSNHAASRVAGGIMNPVTGKRLVRSWMTERLAPFALNTYRQLEQELNTPLVTECAILDFFANREEQELFTGKLAGESEYLFMEAERHQWESYFNFNYDIGLISPCLLVDLRAVLNGVSGWLNINGCCLEERFLWKDCIVEEDKVVYKSIEAGKIICCEGADGTENPLFGLLPWSKDKGEAIIAAIPGLPRNHIYKRHISIAPWQGGDLFWIGATHDWKYTDLEPSQAFRIKVEEQLDNWLRLPYIIKDHMVARRPANLERKPFVGLHPKYASVGILNGMGGKGASMAPYFAHELAMHLVEGSPIMPEVNVLRFKNILSRQ
jgi:glycine/D-amino acid oxidase-like deaminating enzyme